MKQNNSSSDSFDFIIVGGGSGGSVLAARLSEDPNISVCLLEAGGNGNSLLVRAPLLTALMIPRWSGINNWCLDTTPQPGLGNRSGYQPRGKCLGGSSAINAMVYIRGHRDDYDQWASEGATGWGFDDLLPLFKLSENNQRGADELHGDSGPLHVSDQRDPRQISRDFVKAGVRFGLNENNDFNGHEQEGVGLYQVTQFHDKANAGERCSAYAAYLRPHRNTRPNLRIITGARATRIQLDKGRARRVEFKHKGNTHTIHARKEVLLSSGAFGSPQLLLLSGIGPNEELARHQIKQQVDLPGVGQNLQDHLDYIHAYKGNTTDVIGIGVVGTAKIAREGLKWMRDGSGMVSSNIAEGGAFFKTTSSEAKPDLQLHFVAAIADDHLNKVHYGYGYSCHVCVLRPKSRGSLRLNSNNPMDAPLIDPAYLANEDDQKRLLQGVKLSRELVNTDPLGTYRRRELYTEGVSDDALMDHIKQRADTIYHPIGTCKMGVNEDAVVDPQLKVRGVDGLRVVDASIMPTLIGGNTNAPTMVIAEKAVQLIRDEWKLELSD